MKEFDALFTVYFYFLTLAIEKIKHFKRLSNKSVLNIIQN